MIFHSVILVLFQLMLRQTISEEIEEVSSWLTEEPENPSDHGLPMDKIKLQNCSVVKRKKNCFYGDILKLVNIIREFGYPAEEHEVITEDGYILPLHRIPKNKSSTAETRVILLMHGIACSSADYVNVSPNVSLAYSFWDAGYDVWIGNARGNSYSRKHLNIDWRKNPEEFYNFSFHEMGKYDLPATINYILNKTEEQRIYYAGHSQGGTSLYTLMALRPEYNEKIRLAVLLGPGGLMGRLPHPIIHPIAEFEKDLQAITNSAGIYRVPFVNLARNFMKRTCQEERFLYFCKKLFFFSGAGFSDDEQINKETFRGLFRTTPSDFSMKQIYHYLQEVSSGKFRHYDYGREGNKRIYGALQPPEYNISKINVPLAIYYGKNDDLMSVKDTQSFIAKLPNVVLDYLVPYEKFNHGDFLWARGVYGMITENILKLMKHY